MANCYRCSNELTAKNKSREHLILNSMGGWLKSSDLLCDACNRKFGHEADNVLADQFAFISAYLQVRRDKGEIPTIKGGRMRDGVEIDLINGVKPRFAKPIFEVKEIDGGIQYHVVSRDIKEMKKILSGLKRKYPSLDVDEAMKKAEIKIERLKEHVQYNQQFGGELAFRSITKTAVNFFMLHSGNRLHIEHLIPYLEGKENKDLVKHYYPKKSLYKKRS